MLLNKQESLPAAFLNASDGEDAVVDEVSLVGFFLFFVAFSQEGLFPN